MPQYFRYIKIKKEISRMNQLQLKQTNLKGIVSLILVATIFTFNCVFAFAHDEKTKDSGDRTMDANGGDSNNGGGTTVTATAEDFKFSVDADAAIATLLYADGTPLANAMVTVKNGQSGQDGDIEMNQSADENGVFDYSKWVGAGAKVLRVTDPKTNSAVEYDVETGAMNIEAGKNKSGDGHTHSTGGGTNTYLMIGGVVAVIAAASGVVIMMQKKKKAAFEAANATKGKKGKAKGTVSNKGTAKA